MIESDFANKLKICLININSFKDCADDRTSELNTIFYNSKANIYIYILTETKLNEEAANKFSNSYLGKTWRHSASTEEDASAGISIAFDPLMGNFILIKLPSCIQNRAIAVRFEPS